jgi:hypothetical protein
MILGDKNATNAEVESFFLTSLVNTPEVEAIRKRIQEKYKQDEYGEWPDLYWQEYSTALRNLLNRAALKAIPQNIKSED